MDGVYLISAQADFSSTDETGFRSVNITKNGVTDTPLLASQTSATPGMSTVHPISTQVELSAGDYVEVVVLQDSGQDLTAFSGSRHFEMTWIAPV